MAHHVDNSEIEKDAYRWFFGAGAFALCLALFVFNADQRLTNSDGEKVRGQIIGELRRAQASLGSANVDPRITHMAADGGAAVEANDHE